MPKAMALFILTDKEGHTFSVFWVLVSVVLGAIAMLCKEQGITILVRILLLTEFSPQHLSGIVAKSTEINLLHS